MEIKTMEVAELQERRNAIVTELENPEANLDALEEEMRAINAELQTRAEEAKREQEQRDLIAQGAVQTTTIEERKVTKAMEIEVRNSEAYLNAYANYIKTNDDTECRALLTENVSGGNIPVPELVYSEIKTAWENEAVMKYVRKAYIQGNLKVGFEISSTGAVVHTEGSGAVSEETLVHGIVNLIPANIKKWVSISDEVLDLSGQAFLEYVYRELAHQIAKKCADELIAKIEACGTASTSTSVAVPKVKTTAKLGAIAEGLALLSDQASNPVILMNKQTWSAFKTAQYAGNFSADIFEGLPVAFNNTIKPYATATTGETFAIVGDLGYGALANFPNGEEIKFNFDDKTLATSDLVRVIGREYVGLGIVAPEAFAKLTK